MPSDSLPLLRAIPPCCAYPMTFTESHRNTWNYSDESGSLSRNWKPIVFLHLDLTMRKYEIYLPLKYNDGSNVEPEKLEEIQQQLMAVFGAMTTSPLSAPFQGTWRHGGVEFVDEIFRIEIITDEELYFFKNLKRQLKRTLRQLDILITVQDVKTI